MTVMGTDGKPKTYFSATAGQRANHSGNTFLTGTASAGSTILPGRAQRDQERLHNLYAINGQA